MAKTVSQIEVNSMTFDIADATARDEVSNLNTRVLTLENTAIGLKDGTYSTEKNFKTSKDITANRVVIKNQGLEFESDNDQISNGGFIDFNYLKGKDWTTRLIEGSAGLLSLYGPSKYVYGGLKLENRNLFLKTNDYDRTKIPPKINSQNTDYWGRNIVFQDTNNVPVAYVTPIRRFNGEQYIRLESFNTHTTEKDKDGKNKEVNNYFQIGISNEGNCSYGVSDKASFRSAIGAAAATSDKRLKTNISPLGQDAIDFVNNLNPVVYTINGERQVGLIAQEVNEVDIWNTKMTFETKENYDGLDDWEKMEDGSPTWKLDYTRIIAPLVATVQKQNKEIEELKEEIKKIKNNN